MTTERPGEMHLRQALRRWARYLAGLSAQPPRSPAPPPETDWERAAERRLSRIEQQLANQNRLLLFTLVSIVADVLFGLTR